MAEIALRNEERIGLAAAVVLHGALVAVLLMQAVRSEVVVFPERITVSLATEVGLENASPEPVAESRASIAPTLAENPAPPAPPAPAPPQRVERTPPPPAPAPAPRPQPSAAPRPAPTSPPRPQPTSAARPAPAPSPPAPSRDRSRPDRTPAPSAAQRPATTPAPPASRSGGSRIGDDFLEGKGSSTTTQETRAPAATFGRAERAALSSAITRQLRPHWTAPSGLDAEQLISTVTWELSPDGTLRGTPRCRTDPSSITDSNRPQAGLHCERAIRAVQRAAPFNLPDQFYDRWKALEWQFDRRL